MRSVGRVSKIEARCTPKKHSPLTAADTATALAVVTVTALAASSPSSHGKTDSAAVRSDCSPGQSDRNACTRAGLDCDLLIAEVRTSPYRPS